MFENKFHFLHSNRGQIYNDSKFKYEFKIDQYSHKENSLNYTNLDGSP